MISCGDIGKIFQRKMLEILQVILRFFAEKSFQSLAIYHFKPLNLKCFGYLVLVVSAVIFLQACADMAITSAQVVYNRRSLQRNFGDQYTTMQAYQALYVKTDEFKDSHIVLATYNNELLLTGQVQHAWQKEKALEIVKKIPDIKRIYNLISHESPTSTLTRMSDAWITGKVKAKLIASEDVDASKVKVVTENGTVYLMGVIPASEAQAAVELAGETGGVERVVKVFTYLKLSKIP